MIVIRWGRDEGLESQKVPSLPSIAFPAGWPLDWSLAAAVQAELESVAILGANESAVVAVSIGLAWPAMVMGPSILAWPPAADVQEPDTNARPAMTTRAVTAEVQNLFTKKHLRSVAATPLRAALTQREGWTLAGR